MTSLKNEKDQIEAERQVAYNKCPRGDNACRRHVRETFAPPLTDIKNKETIENSRHRQEERTLGQVKRDCKLYDRMDKRTKSP